MRRLWPAAILCPISTYLQFLLLGLGAGAIYAAQAMGLVLTYRASGVINFAHGAVAMYATYVFVGLRSTGQLLLPLPGSAGLIHVGTLPTAAAALVAVAAAALLQLGCYWLIFRPLRSAPPLSAVVATVGLMVALQAIVTIRFGSDSVLVQSVLPDRPLSIGSIRLPEDRLYLTGIVILLACALWAVYRFTAFGIASRAAAEDDTGLSLLGWSPHLVAGANWMLAGVIAAVAGILVAPITTLDPVTFTLLVVPALAAALVGGLTSFGWTVAAALALGMLQSELVQVQLHASWLPATGISRALPLVLVIAVAFARGTLVPARTTTVVRRLSVVGRPRQPLLGLFALLAGGSIALVASHGTYRLALVTSIVAAIACLSLVVLTGYLGQLSLAQMAFAGVAGFILAKVQRDLGVPFPVDVALAALAAAVTGLLIGIPALRVRGPALAVATLAGGIAVESLLFQDPRVTGGLAGTKVSGPTMFGLHFGPGAGGSDYPHVAFGLFALVVLCLIAAGVLWLRQGAMGRRMLAVRANERAAEAAGVALTSTKLAGFAISAFIAGIAGAMLGWQQTQLSFGSFDVFVSLALVAVAYVGGIGRVSGALVGGALVASGLVFTALDSAAGIGRYQLFVSGVAVIAFTVLAPDGITGVADRLTVSWRRR